jgi:hypothetical protein
MKYHLKKENSFLSLCGRGSRRSPVELITIEQWNALAKDVQVLKCKICSELYEKHPEKKSLEEVNAD